VFCRTVKWFLTSHSPLVDGDRIYTLSREGHLFCFHAASGEIVWSKNLKEMLRGKLPEHGFACHPFIVGNMMILEIGAEGGSIVAFGKANNGVIWESDETKVGYSTLSP